CASNWPNCGEARSPPDLRTDPTNGEPRPNRRRSIGPDERAPQKEALALEVRTDAMNSLGSHIWDLRKGDADDNRTSPYGRGWRNVVISTAMEFNYLTATVSFIMLVIVPALLVGLAPPLFIIYSRKTFGAAGAIVNHPVYALSMIGVLIVLGLR